MPKLKVLSHKTSRYEAYVSQVDDEEIKTLESRGYRTISDKKKSGEYLLHVYEAKKVFNLLDIPWLAGSDVHHINYVKCDISLDNLHVFPSRSNHITHHNHLEKSMYDFLWEFDLLDRFYEEHPECRLKTLKELLLDALEHKKL